MTYVVCLHHPSFIMRGNWGLRYTQPVFLAKAKEIADKGYYEFMDMETVPDNANLFPTERDLEIFAAKIVKPCSVDIECAGRFLVCVGICHQDTWDYTCIRFRDKGGAVHQPEWLEARARWLSDFLADPNIKKIFHNGQAFDIPYLEQQGFVVNGFEGDTMLQSHCHLAEMPKKLSFLALAYLDFPNWKTLVNEKDEEKENQ